MRNIDYPNIEYVEVYNACRLRIVEPGRTSLMVSCDDLCCQEKSYAAIARRSELFLIDPHKSDGDNSKNNHEKLYDGHFSKESSPNRIYYDRLMSIKRRSLCPYCGFAKINHVDHFLPKSIFFRYSVMPGNLIPCCSDCNTAKGDYYGKTRSSSLFHPYYDAAPVSRWLCVDVSFTPDFSIKYIARQQGDNIDWLTEARLVNNLMKLKISEGYECLAAENLVSLKSVFMSILLDDGPDALRDYISDIREQALMDARGDLNSWKVCLYDALLLSADFFTERGIEMIGS